MDEKKKELLYKTLVAQGLADAFGYLIEFTKWEDLKARYGLEGLKYQPEKLDLWASDDTQMTLFCLNAMIEERQKANLNAKAIEDPIPAIYDNYLAWLHTQTKQGLNRNNFLLDFRELFMRQAPGNTCLSALGSGKMGTIENPINDSKGCGTIMRTLPVSFFANSIEQAFEWGAKQGAITHGHPDGYLSSGLYSAIVYELLYNTQDLVKATHQATKILDDYENSQSLKNTINKTLWLIKDAPQMEHDTMAEQLGYGWVADEAFSVALYCATTCVSFAQVVEKASNHSGDSDSTAMLAAGLWYLANRDDSFMKDATKLDLHQCIVKLMQRV